eukprot:15843269-Heterocapsa_arctica.AAC.1
MNSLDLPEPSRNRVPVSLPSSGLLNQRISAWTLGGVNRWEGLGNNPLAKASPTASPCSRASLAALRSKEEIAGSKAMPGLPGLAPMGVA